MSGGWDWKGLHTADAVAELATRLHQPAQVVPFGLPSLDRNLWYWGDRKGIPRGEYVVLAGASNAGKTQLALYLLKQAAEHGEKAAILSLEMQREDLLLRLYQGMSDMGPREWMPSSWSDQHTAELRRAVRAHGEKIRGEIMVNGGYTADLDGILEALQEAVDSGSTFFVIDHLQLIRVKGYSADQVSSRVEVAGEALRSFAFSNRVTLCALSQLTIAASRDRTQSPDMYSLWGGMAVGSNASLVVICDHTLYRQDERQSHLARTWLLLGKNRMGPKQIRVPVLWDHANLTLTEAMPHEEHEWPTHD